MLAFNAGSRHESPSERGAAHFSEHMVFRGGERFVSETAIDRRALDLGMDINANTSQEIVSFFVSARAEAVMGALELLTDIVSAPQLREDDIELERAVILHEMAEESDDPFEQAPALANRAMFGDAGLGSPILGTPETVKSLSPRTLRSFQAARWQAKNGAALIVGNVRHFDAAAAQDMLARFPSAEAPSAARQALSLGVTLREIRNSKHTQLAANYAMVPHAHQNLRWRAAAKILNNVLRIRLMEELRQRQGLCYGAYARVHESDTPFVQIVSSVASDRSGEALNEIQRIVEDLGSLDEEEFARVRSYCAGIQAVRLEDRLKAASFLASSALTHSERNLSISAWIQALDRCTLSDVKKLAQQIDPQASVGLVGPEL